ncbi:zinc-binding dehydrogenase [Streptomyces sparsogenes]|uniref:zinc-binding dehydrogenase n=1 Tax=Streptomyces sparsogenes TaxID=67365 RepID=UPI0033E6A2E7
MPGASPRVRATEEDARARPRGGGTIPAGAGNSATGASSATRPWDHPRGCGEQLGRSTDRDLELGRESFSLLAAGSGRQIVFGFSSGQPLDVKPTELFGRGLTLTGFSAGLIWNRPALARELVTDVLDLAVTGQIKPVVGQSFPLERAADAHAAMESRSTVGKTLLIP